MHALQKLVMERQWLESMKYYTKFWLVSVTNFCNVFVAARHTGMLEAFHSIILAYCSNLSVSPFIYFNLFENDVMHTLFQEPGIYSKNAVSSLRPQCPYRPSTIQK